LLNEAALISVARDSKLIENDDMERAYLNVVAGADRKPNATGEEMCIIALHEAGHAVISKKLMPETRIKRISILPAGRSMAGYNLSIHTDKTLFVKDELEKQITVLFGGRAAELLVNGSEGLTSGASDDLAKAAEIAGIMITEFGMGSSPEISLRSLGNICTGTMRAEEEIRKTLEDSFSKAKEILIGNMDLLMYLTDKLVENEVLTEDEINRIFDEWDSRADLY